MNDLMELIRTCEEATQTKQPNYAALELAGELGKLGLDKMAKKLGKEFLVAEKLQCVAQEKYSVVTEAKIQKFLEGLAKDYNAKRKKNTIILDGHTLNYTVHPQTPDGLLAANISFTGVMNSLYDDGPMMTGNSRLSASTCDYLSNDPGSIGSYRWNEVKISEYLGIPPASALKALRVAQEKEIFDYYTIASVSAVKDPLLLGRIEGVEDRFYLAQWGDDVSLDDVI